MERKSVDINKVTPMMRQYLEIKNANEDLIIFFRLGDFYEMFFDDAVTASRELELTLTGKSAGLEERIPMCGIPYHAASSYIDKLIEKGYKIGICEQLEDAKNVKGIVKRDITQIVSSGTIMNSDTIKSNDFNYIANIVDFKHAFGISYADVSTGEIYVLLLEHNPSKVVSEIVNLGVKEVVITDKVDKSIYSILKNQFHLTLSISNEVTDKYSNVYNHLTDQRHIETVKHLIYYIENNQKRSLDHLQEVNIKENKDYLKMDVHTKRNLELVETLRLKERNFSLIWLLDKTKTAMGARLLKKYILSPLVDKEEIERRYDCVDILLKEFLLKSDLETYLNEVYDLERLSGKIAFGSANARDMLQLKNSLGVLPEISNVLKQINFYI